MIIGAGPAAAAAGRALAASGVKALLLDAGKADALSPAPSFNGPYETWRNDSASQWRDLIGEDFSALRNRNASPKFSVPRFADAFARGMKGAGVETHNFSLAAIEGVGGLSVAWGAGLACFTARDMQDWPISPRDLAAHYTSEARVVSAAGLIDDGLTDDMGAALGVCPPPPISSLAQGLLDRADRRSLATGIRIGRARNAIRTRSETGQFICDNRHACIFGCADGAIYNAADDIAQLVRTGSVELRHGFRVHHIERDCPDWRIIGVDSKGIAQEVRTKKIFLAAGTLQSTAIVLRSLHAERSRLRLHSNPVGAFGVLDPLKLGTTPAAKGNALSAIGISIDHPNRPETLYAGLFTTSGILRSHLIKRLPLARGAGRQVARALSPAMLLGNLFFPSSYSDHSVELDDRGVLIVRGGYGAELPHALKLANRQLQSLFGQLRCMMAPGGVQLAPPGADAHYAGTLPHRSNPGPLETDARGRLPAMPGVFVIDGSVLPSLPAKSHTLTIMANARRIVQTDMTAG